MLIYIIGSYIRRNEITVKSKKAILGIVIIVIIITTMAYIEHICGFEKTVTWNYNNPLVIFMAILVFLLFKNFKLYSRVINKFARAGFTCYLIHAYFLPKLVKGSIVNGNVFLLFIHQIVVGIGLYILSYLVNSLYEMGITLFIKKIEPMCNKINISIE